ncbi:MAG: PsiF family protein [Pseudomonadota bacterium]
MKYLMTVLALSAACLSTSAFATTHKEAPDMAKGASAPMGKQQSKMGECNKDAGDKKGDDRKAFMKTCLSAKKVSQQDKMKACNADPKAKAAKGDERKAFMKTCLSA